MKFINVTSSEQARRGWWRVTLAGQVFDLGFFTTNPLKTWTDRVEDWRMAINADGAKLSAYCSPAAVCKPEGTLDPGGTGLIGARAVVDVHVNGTEIGQTVADVVRRMNDLTPNIDVVALEIVNNADPVARDAACLDAVKESDPLGLAHIADVLELLVKFGAVVALIYVTAKLIQAAKE